MGAKIGVILGAIAAAVGLWYLYQYISTQAAIAKTATPGVLPLTPVNPIPVNLTALPAWGNPSPVSPTPTYNGTFTTQPSYSMFLSQQTDASLLSGNLPLPSTISPSLVTMQNSVDDNVVMAGAPGVDPPGISNDASNYGGTGDVFYS